ncbi:MAG: peptidylprolyl isomerase [Oscillospiraceae bacterium]|nr:peptidylprolyl isomerase [Oscillospiraceae bacterium]
MENNNKKATPGKIALAVVAVVLLAAVLIGMISVGFSAVAAETTVEESVEVVSVEYTIPNDGNPADETAKGSYTASDEAVRAAADTVVATMGDYTLTNGQLQVYYWMEVQNFLSSYGSYAAYFGLDVSQPLDMQVCGLSELGETWQQFFLASALNTWKNHQVLAAEAELANYEMDAAMAAELENTRASMEQNAAMYGFESAEELLAYNVGRGASIEDYLHFMNLYYPGTLYFNEQVVANGPTAEEVEAYFTENEEAYLQNGLAREDKYVDVRHVLIMPEGADSSNIRTETFDEAAWEAGRVKAEELLAAWEADDKSEESFAQLAVDHSQDGSAVNGGLYTDVVKGQMVEAFENWCFDETRAYGDYGIVKTEFGYHLMFYVGSRPVWVEYAESDLMNQRASELLNTLLAKYTMEADFENILLAYVDIDGETAEETPSETVIQAEPLLNEETKPVLLIAAVSAAALCAAAYVLNKKEHE